MFRSPLAIACLALLAGLAEAQELPFSVIIVDWQPEVLERQRRGYRSASGEGEVLHCVESWTTSEARPGVDRVVITAVRRARTGEDHRIRDVGKLCLDQNGTAQPMIHSHTDGNCQPSPADLVTIAARNAPFEGVQCGERHFVWIFAWQVRAIALAAERERVGQVAGRPN